MIRNDASPAVSVVLNVYNGERFLQAALESVFKQTFTDFELIVVNNGSTDATPAIIQQFAHDPRLVVLHLPHPGICASLNAGLAAARADLIAKLDADDVMLPNRLERQLAYLRDHPQLTGAGSFYEIMDEKGKICGTKQIPLCTTEQVQSYLDSGGHLIFSHPTMIFSKRVALELGGYRVQYEKCEDVDLFLRMIESGHLITVQPEYLTRMRYHADSVTANNTRRQYHLNQIIFGNYRRQAAGKPRISPEEYYQALKGRPLSARLQTEAGVQSALLMRKRDIALLRGRRLQGATLLAAAALLNPVLTWRKTKRVIGRLLRQPERKASLRS